MQLGRVRATSRRTLTPGRGSAVWGRLCLIGYGYSWRFLSSALAAGLAGAVACGLLTGSLRARHTGLQGVGLFWRGWETSRPASFGLIRVE